MKPRVANRAAVCAAIALAIISLVVRPALGDEPPAVAGDAARIAVQIHELVEQLQSVRGERRDADERLRDAIARTDRQIETLQAQVAESERAVAEQREQIAALDAAVAADKHTSAAAGAWIAGVADRIAPVADRARRRIERSAAGDAAARASDLSDALTLLGDGDDGDGDGDNNGGDPQRRGEGAGDVLRILGEGWLAARTVSVTNEPIVLDAGQRSQHAWVYRLGLVSKAFVSEDGQTVGLWSGEPSSPWRVDLTEQQREQVRALFEIVRERQPPAVVPAPIFRAASSSPAAGG